MNAEINKELLFKYFSGLTTPLENTRIEGWLSKEKNEEVFFLFLEEWERSNAQYLPRKEEVFLNFKNKLNGRKSRNSGSRSFYFFASALTYGKWMGIAAAFVLMLVGAFIFKDYIIYKHYTTRYGETMTLILDDDSQVVLNANTELKVPRWMNYREAREVWMKGEAFFNVSKKEGKNTFLVHTDNLDVEVLGTRFNVNDRRDATKVVLQEGRVKVLANSRAGETVMLEKTGDYAEVRGNDRKLITKTVDESLYTTWQEKRLKFENTPLPYVIQTIEDYYGVKVVAKDSTLKDRKFSGTLPNNDLDLILHALSNIYNSKFNSMKSEK